MTIIGIAIGVLLTITILKLQDYLKSKNQELNWINIFAITVAIYLIYSFLGIIISSPYKESNSTCRGFNYGIHVCSGDANEQ